MARPSARPRMIEAALRVAEEHGTSAVTLDSVAEQAQVTKRGLLYHFPSKHALIAGIHEHLAARFDQELLEATGKVPESASLVERTRGYIQVALRTPNTVELQFILEAGGEPDWLAPWERVNQRWFPEATTPVEDLDAVALRCLIARMAADGSWGQESTRSAPMSPQARERLTLAILALLD